MKVEVLHCPNCNSNINDEKSSFCPYCGSKLFIDDGIRKIEINKNIKIDKTITKSTRDETEIYKEEMRDRRNRRYYRSMLFCFIAMLSIGIILFLFEKYEHQDDVYVQTSAKKFEGRNYQGVISELEGLGFTDIEANPVQAVWYKKDGSIERISINGNSEFNTNTYFPKDAPIVITYYSKEK